MNLDLIKNIAHYKAIAEETKLMLDEFDGMSSSSLNAIKDGTGSPDGRMISIISKRDRIRKMLLDDFNAYLDAMEKGLTELKTIQDLKIRNIMNLRFVKGYRWEQVAKSLGGTATSDSIKKTIERFITQNAKTE